MNDEQKRLWVLFVENNGVNAQSILVTSKLCSRHFVPGVDYTAGIGVRRRRLFNNTVPSVVSIIS